MLVLNLKAKGDGSWRAWPFHRQVAEWSGTSPLRCPLQLGVCLERSAKCRAPGSGCQTSAACPKQLSKRGPRRFTRPWSEQPSLTGTRRREGDGGTVQANAKQHLPRAASGLQEPGSVRRTARSFQTARFLQQPQPGTRASDSNPQRARSPQLTRLVRSQESRNRESKKSQASVACHRS